MASYGTGLDIGEFTAGQNIEAYKFVLISNKQIVSPKEGEYADGVSFEPCNPGQPVRVRVYGTIKVVLGAQVKNGDFLMTNSNGEAVPAAEGKMILAKALEQGNQGQVIEVLLKTIPQFVTPPVTPPTNEEEA